MITRPSISKGRPSRFGWPAERKAELNAAQEADFEELLSRLEPGNRGLLAKLASDWGSEKFQMYFQQVVADLLAKLDATSATEQTRIEAVQQLVEFQPHSAALVRELVNRISPQLPPAVAIGLVRALQLSESSETGTLLIDRFAALTPAARQAGITVLLARPGSTRALLDGVDKGAVQLSELSLDQKQALALKLIAFRVPTEIVVIVEYQDACCRVFLAKKMCS